MEEIKNNVEDVNEIVDNKVDELKDNVDDNKPKKTNRNKMCVVILVLVVIFATLCFWEVQYNNSMNHKFNRYTLLKPEYYYCLEINQYNESACWQEKVYLDLPSRRDFYWFGIMNMIDPPSIDYFRE